MVSLVTNPSKNPNDWGVGDIVPVSGYVTQAKFLHGQPGPEIERRIGYAIGRCANGWALTYLVKKPSAADIGLRGYSQLSGGKPLGHLPENEHAPNVEETAAATNWNVARMKANLMTSGAITIEGPNRLAKATPLLREVDGAEYQYPPGSGIPQWELSEDFPARVIAILGPRAAYTGGYAR